ncbi:MAG: DinB family protein [Gemmatimonadota bacterium]
MLDQEILADQIGRAVRGGAWHGPSVGEVLAGVSAEDAAAHPIPDAHSIWEIVLHLIGGYTLVLRRLGGERLQLSPQEAWPPVTEVSAAAWRESQDALGQLNERLQSAVRAFPSQRLSDELGSGFEAYVQFCGAPQHDAYHAGQIVMLKKALAASREAS